MSDVLVIGGNGFIGAHLVALLVAEGFSVTVFDRFSNGLPTYAAPTVRAVAGDFLNRGDVRRAVAGHRLVVHMLSTTTPATAGDDPTVDLRTNVIPTIELLEDCVDAGVDHVYFASTGGAIYGGAQTGVVAEDAPTLPVSPYAIGKLAIENSLRYFQSVHGLASTSMRISNPYGPGQRGRRGQGLIPIAIRAVLAGEPVVRFGDGSMVRDYIYVDDLVEMMLRLIRSTPSHPVYNLGSGIGATVSDVLSLIERVVGRGFAVERRDTPPTFVQRIVLDPSRFRHEFGEVPVTVLEEGIRRTLDDLRAKDAH